MFSLLSLYKKHTSRDYPDVLYLVENAVTTQLTGCDIVRISCTVNTVHYCPNADGVVAISNKVCDVVHVFFSDIRTTLSGVVCIHPGHVVADPAHVALHWCVGPVEGNAGILTAVNVFNSGLLRPCSGQKWVCVNLNLIQHIIPNKDAINLRT